MQTSSSNSSFAQFLFVIAIAFVAVAIYLIGQVIKSIFWFVTHPEVRFFLWANWQELREFIASFDYAIANLRCYATNLFVSQEIIDLKYFEE